MSVADSGFDANLGMAVPAATGSLEDRLVRFTYDRMGRRLTQTQVGVAQGEQRIRADATTRYAYDAVGNTTRVTDALGTTTYSYYDALGRLDRLQEAAATGVENPAGKFRRGRG